jgi:hypothetical protein
MSNDFDFTQPTSNFKRIDYKRVFFNLPQGRSVIRLVNMKAGKKRPAHFIMTYKKTKQFIPCAGSGCPLCVQGDKPKNRYFLKVIDRNTGLLKVWEFGGQIRGLITELYSDITSKGGTEKLEDYNIIVKRREPGANPLYTISLGEKIAPTTEVLRNMIENDKELIASDDIDLEMLTEPWNVDKVNRIALGIGADSKDGEGGSAPSGDSAPKAAGGATAKADDTWLDD